MAKKRSEFSTDQVNVRLDKALIARLKGNAERYGRDSHNEIMIEILERYLSFWEEAEEAKFAVIQKQKAAAHDAAQVIAHLRPPGEPDLTPVAVLDLGKRAPEIPKKKRQSQ